MNPGNKREITAHLNLEVTLFKGIRRPHGTRRFCFDIDHYDPGFYITGIGDHVVHIQANQRADLSATPRIGILPGQIDKPNQIAQGCDRRVSHSDQAATDIVGCACLPKYA
jgi:hypothetical protein